MKRSIGLKIMSSFLVILNKIFKKFKKEVNKPLINQYRHISINYEQLDTLQFSSNEPFVLAIEWEGITYEFLIRIKSNSNKLLVLGSGAMNFNENRIPPPFFQRHSWINQLAGSVIYYNDPTLYLGNQLLVGWGQGTKDRYSLHDIAKIIEKLIRLTQVPSSNVLFYGSSAGGFMSLILAGHIKESKALVNSPQTCLTKWLKTPVKQVFDLSYPGLTIDEIMQQYPDRINVMRFFQKIKYVPEIHYLQNAYCEIDMKDHVIPFIEWLQSNGEKCVVNKVKFYFYYTIQPGPAVHPALGGHGALDINSTIKYINKIQNEHDFEN